MKKNAVLSIVLLLLSVPLPAFSASEDSAHNTPPPPDSSQPAQQVEYDAICSCSNANSYALGLVDSLKILAAKNSAISNVEVEVLLRPAEVISGKVSLYESTLGLSLYDAAAPNLLSPDRESAPGFSAYANGLDNMMFSKCKVNYQQTLNLRGLLSGQPFSTSNTTTIEMIGVFQTGLAALPNTGIRAVSSPYGTTLSTISNAKKSAKRRRRR